jgi:DNA-binding FadR family transcriptional regulator
MYNARVAESRKADVVANGLLREIVSGVISVGSLLPKEDALAARYGVNRSVIREAIKLLEVHRLVHPRRRRGTEVLDPMASLSPEVIEAMLSPRPGRLDPEVLADLLELRAGIDRQMTVLAAERRTTADLEALRASVDAIEEALVDPSAYDVEVDRFVLLVARASHNRLFEMLVHWNQRVSRQLREVFRVARPIGSPHVEALRMLVAMLEARRGEELGALVSAYHAWAIPRMMAAAALRGGTPLSSIAEAATQE